MEKIEAIGKFKNTEEEVAYLRSQLEKKERELKEKSVESSTETVAKEVVKEYIALEPKKILPEEKIVTKAEAEQIVLRLRPEPHDSKMEELLGILMDRGIKNALLVVEHFDNPHLDDDFQRFLVQYLSSMGEIPGLRESMDIYKGLRMKLFEVALPELDKGDSRTFKDFISAMEQFYAGMQFVGGGKDNFERNYFTLEIAVSDNGEEIVFYAGIPVSRVELFEKQVLSFYAQAKITEVPNDYNIFNINGYSAGSYAKFAKHQALPIKTYEAYDHDPMNSLLNALSKLRKEGEGAAIQFIICPAGERFTKEFNDVLKDVKNGLPLKQKTEVFSEFDRMFAKAVKELVFGFEKKEDKDKEKKIDDVLVQKITEKTRSTIINSNIRVITSAETRERAEEILYDIESTFTQFLDVGGNNFEFEKIKEKDLHALLHDFSYRIFNEKQGMALNFKELSTIFHYPVGIKSTPHLKQAKAGIAPAPVEVSRIDQENGIFLGVNTYRGVENKIYMAKEDRMRHFYVVGQTGTGKTTILKNMIAQDILNGEGCCFIDPHGSDIQDILSYVPKERLDDVIYFDPAYTARPMGLNMLEFDPKYPEQKSLVVDELMGIFNKLFDMKAGGGAMFEQYFKNSALLVMEHPESGCTLLEITRVLGDKNFRDMKLSHCKNPIIANFWKAAEETSGEQSLANFVPYISSKFDPFISNEIMRPVVLQEKSVFNFRKIMDEKKILLVNLSKGRLGEINANLIGLILVGKIQMAALSRADMYGQKMNDFYLYIDEFQNVTTDSIASILSEARKYRLSLTIAHQYLNQLTENIKNAVFGNVGSMAIYRVSSEDAQALEPRVAPTFTASDVVKLDNFNSYISMLANGTPVKPFSMTAHWSIGAKGNKEIVEDLKQLSYLKYGRDREEVEEEIKDKFTMF